MALVITLLFLLLIAVLSASSVGTTTLEEKMAGNARDGNLAFQAAESALRDAELFIDNQTDLSAFDNSGGLYAIDQDEPAGAFDPAQWTASNSRAYTGSLAKVASQPRYRIKVRVFKPGGRETLQLRGYGRPAGGGDSAILRITARGTGGSDAGQVVLQSHYGRALPPSATP